MSFYRNGFTIAVGLLGLGTLLASAPARAEGDWFVKQKRQSLRAGPSAGTQESTSVSQGATLKELKRTGLWLEVQTEQGRRGWVLSTMLSRSPVASGEGDELSDSGTSEIKKARSRPRIKSATMGVRGLRSTQLARGRSEGDHARKGSVGLEKMEQTQPTEELIEKAHSELVGTRKEE